MLLFAQTCCEAPASPAIDLIFEPLVKAEALLIIEICGVIRLQRGTRLGERLMEGRAADKNKFGFDGRRSCAMNT